MTNRNPKRLLALLAAAALVGCQQPGAPVVPFGATLTPTSSAVTDLPEDLTRGLPTSAGSFVSNELIVALEAGADSRSTLEGFTVLGELMLDRRYARIRLPEGTSLTEAYAQLKERAGVSALALNHVLHTADVDDSAPTRLDEQWAHRVTGAMEHLGDLSALGITPEKLKDVIVAVADTGIQSTHPEFQLAGGESTLVAPQNLTDDNAADPTDPSDGHGHGTHVSGIVGALGKVMVGVAPGVSIMPIKTITNMDSTTTFTIAQALAYAWGEDLDGDGPRKAYPEVLGDDRRVRVVNMSLGIPMQGHNLVIDAAMREARKRGLLLVISAGNSAVDLTPPANSLPAFTVSSTSHFRLGDLIWESLSGFSSRGDAVDVAGPGGQILSSVLASGYGFKSGTSMAAPYVAGLAALVIAKHPPRPDEDPEQYVTDVENHLRRTADDLGAPGKDPKYGYGRVNVHRALTEDFARDTTAP